MGQSAPYSTYVLLYIDGLFWGMYYMIERPDADFAASHLGGTAADWEDNNDGHETDGSATNLPYWNEFQALAAEPASVTDTLAFYEQVQGNNAWFYQTYGEITDYPDLLNMTDYIDYMLMNIYIGNVDWPNHNFYAAIDTDGPNGTPTGFVFFSWDAEITLGLISDVQHTSRATSTPMRRATVTAHSITATPTWPRCTSCWPRTRSSTWPSPTRRGSSCSTAAR